MASFVIEGGHKLHGEIHPQGAKNEVLQILCATLLTSEEVTVTNIPDILDVNNLIQLLRDMGVKVSKTGIDSYTFKADTVDLNYLESDEFLTVHDLLFRIVYDTFIGFLLSFHPYTNNSKDYGKNKKTID